MTASRTDTDARPDRADTGFFGQPSVLANLFGVELWERFSFLWIGLAAVVTGVAMLTLTRPISRMMKGVR